MWALAGAQTLDVDPDCAPHFVADVTEPLKAALLQSIGKFDMIVTCYCFGDIYNTAQQFVDNARRLLSKGGTLACLVPVSERHRAEQLSVKRAVRHAATAAGLVRLGNPQKRAFCTAMWYLNTNADEGFGEWYAKHWMDGIGREVDIYVHSTGTPWFSGA